MNHGFPKASVDWRSCPETHRRIKVVHAFEGFSALKIRYPGFHANPVARFKVFYVCARFYYSTACLMAQNHGGVNDKIPNPPFSVIVDIAAANTAGFYRYLYVIGACRLGNRVVPETYFFPFLKYQCFHGILRIRCVYCMIDTIWRNIVQGEVKPCSRLLEL